MPLRTQIPLIRVSALIPAVRLFLRQGIRVERFMERAGLPLEVLTRPEALVPLTQVARFLEDVARADGGPAMGIMVGQQANLHDLGTFGRVIEQASTLRDLLNTLFVVAPSHNSGVTWWLEEDGEYVRLCHRFADRLDGSRVQASQYAIAMAARTIGRAAGPHWRPASMQLAVGTAGGRALDGHALKDIPMRFDPRVSALTFERALFAQPLPRSSIAPPPDAGSLEEWRDRGPATQFPQIVLQVLQTLSVDGVPPTVGTTSAALGISVRTLQRWLAAQGNSFEALIGTNRLMAARHLLDHTDAKVVEIALELGYSDHAHFTRAFRRWTGLSPVAYRRARQSSSPLAATG